MDINSDESSQSSNVDPEEILGSLQGIDDMDANLFQPKKSKNQPSNKQNTTARAKSNQSATKKSFTEKKKVSFVDDSFNKKKGEDLGFDLDDPLADLSFDDSSHADIQPKAKPVSRTKREVKSFSTNDKPKDTSKDAFDPNDSLFADDDNDAFDALDFGDDDDKPTVAASNRNTSARLDNLLTVKTTAASPKTSENKRKTVFDKEGNFIKESFQQNATKIESAKSPAADQDISFGGYQPSVVASATGGRNAKPLPGAKKQSSDNFFDFLSDLDTKPTSKASTSIPTASNESDRAGQTGNGRSKAVDFLGLGDEMDLAAVTRPSSFPTRRRPSASSKTEQTVRKDAESPASSIVSEDPLVMSRPPRIRPSPLTSPLVAPSSPQLIPASSTPATIKPRSTTTTGSTSVDKEADILNDLASTPTSAGRTDRAARRPFRDATPSPLPVTPVFQQNVRTPTRNLVTPEDLHAGAGNSTGRTMPTDAEVRSLQSQLEHMRALLHEAQLGFRADLELSQQTYDARIELFQRSLVEMRQRSEREVESIRESYAARLDVVRDQSREHAKEAAGRDLIEQEEIRRLREFHLKALEETRQDYEHQVGRLKRTHADELDALKTSSVFARNVDDTMGKVNSAIQLLQQLAAKYDSACHVMTQQSENTAATSSKMLSVVQSQLQLLQRTNNESQISLQQTVSKLEGGISEMNRRFEEQKYQMQSEHNRLLSAQTSMETEKKQLLQQLALEKEQARKAHADALELQQRFQREIREEREKFARREEESRQAARLLEEARAAELERIAQRENERQIAADDLQRERAALAARAERAATLEAKLVVQKKDLDRRNEALSESERMMEDKREKIVKQDREAKDLLAKNAQKIAESTQALEEAKHIEREHESRLAAIHAQSAEVARQRQLLAEERKLLVEDRMDPVRPNDHRPATASPIPSKNFQYDVTPVRLRSSNVTRAFASSPAPVVIEDPNAVLWQHSADKDRDFLDDEQYFLETLKRSPYHVLKT